MKNGSHPIFTNDRIFLDCDASCKREALRYAAQRSAHAAGCDAATVLDGIMQRERVGSTGFGHGVAIPHSKITGLRDVYAGLFVFSQPFPYDSVDNLPVDIAILLLAPRDAVSDHLKLLAKIARIFRNQQLCASVREAKSVAAVQAALVKFSALPISE